MCLVLACAFLLGCSPMYDTDIWWHLRTGQLILQRGELPYADWYTFTDPDKLWIDLHWGFQLLAAGLYRLGGVNFLVLYKAVTLTLAVAIGWMASGKTLPAWVKAAIWLMPMVCLSGRAKERPEMLSLIFLGLWLWILGNLETRPKLLWLLPLLQVVWVNCHALFVLGIVVGAAFAADRVVREYAGGRFGLAPAPEYPTLINVFRVGVLVLLAALVNPYFEEGAFFPLVLYRKFSVDQAFYSSIGEFQRPIDFVRNSGWMLFRNLYFLSRIGVWLLTAASFLWLGFERRWSVMRLLLFAGFSHLAWVALRNAGIFSLVSAVLACTNCAEAWVLRTARIRAIDPVPTGKRKKRSGTAGQASGGIRHFETVERAGSSTRVIEAARRVSNGNRRGQLACAAALLYGVFIISIVTGYWGKWGGEGRRFGLGEANAWFGHRAAIFAGQKGFPKRAFVDMGQAAVYIFHNAPERRVFMDGRLEVASKETFASYIGIEELMAASNPSWQTLLKDKYGNLPSVILDSRFSEAQLNGFTRMPGWRLVFADRAAAVFLDVTTADRLHLLPVDPSPLRHPPPF